MHLEVLFDVSIQHVVMLVLFTGMWSLLARAVWWQWKRPLESLSTEAEITSLHSQRGGIAISYRFFDRLGRKRTSGFFMVTDMAKENPAFKPGLRKGDRLRITYCAYAPVLSYVEPYSRVFRNNAVFAALFVTLAMAVMIPHFISHDLRHLIALLKGLF